MSLPPLLLAIFQMTGPFPVREGLNAALFRWVRSGDVIEKAESNEAPWIYHRAINKGLPQKLTPDIGEYINKSNAMLSFSESCWLFGNWA